MPSANGSAVIFCDGHNNPGFSGGPILSVATDHAVTVIGVVSAYEAREEPILLDGKDTGLRYEANTGIVVGYGLREVVSEAACAKSGAKITI